MKAVATVVFFLALSFSLSATLVLRENIQFDFDVWRVNSDQRLTLEDFMRQSEGFIIEKIDIEGHCDELGSEYYNLELSEKRALAVYDVLVERVPDEGDYEIRYVGERHPLSLKNDDLNRCVVVTMYLLEPNVHYRGENLTVDLFPEEFPKRVAMEPTEVQPVKQTRQPPKSTLIPENFKELGQFRIESIYFHGNSAVVKSESDPALEELAEFMLFYDDIHIRIEGHVNGKMGRGYLKKASRSNPERHAYKNGKDLSLARAESVKDYLVAQGVDESRVECEGKGGSEMLYKRPKTQKENAANRRIEIIIVNN
ncbi:MAG: OmpA family protein [Flavobacteriales bacterium]|nr:OmpA family protein [Flavobacteriales bacterium]